MHKLFMLIVEQDNSNEHARDIPHGIYRLCTEIDSTTYVCEIKRTKCSPADCKEDLYDGIAEVLDEKEGVILGTNKPVGIVDGQRLVRNIKYFRYKLNRKISETENGTVLSLPHVKFKDSWKSLIYPEKIKYGLLSHLLKIKNIDKSLESIFGINKCILIHGAPGTGKSTLCRALCQKMAIRTGKCVLREINCAQIFSRFYGESLKILNKLISYPDSIYIIDEVESFMCDRTNIFSKNEPNDSLRIVNLFLKKIDRSENIFIFTSNLFECLDSAFVDRCDLIFKMDFLNDESVYALLVYLLKGLMKAGMVSYYEFLEYSSIQEMQDLSDILSFNLYQLSSKVANKVSARKIKKAIFDSLDCNAREDVADMIEKISKRLN